MVKTFKNLLLRNRKANDLETLYAFCSNGPGPMAKMAAMPIQGHMAMPIYGKNL